MRPANPAGRISEQSQSKTMFLTPEIAKAQLRILSDDEDTDLALKAAAAEKAVISHLDRAVFETQAELDAAIAAIPAALSAAKAAYMLADLDASLIADAELCLIERAHALDVYSRAVFAAARTRRGVLIDPVILAEMQLALEDLYEREGYAPTRLMDAYRHYGA